MSTTTDRLAFMRMMGLTDADVADPDGDHAQPPPRPQRGAPSYPLSSGATATTTTSYHFTSGSGAPKRGSPSASSAAGLSHSTSLPGDEGADVSWGTQESGRSFRTDFPSARSSGTTSRGAAKADAYRSAPPAHAAAASPLHAASVSEALKEEGNRAFENGAFAEAVRHYSAAIDALAPSVGDAASTGATDRTSRIGAPARSAEVELLAALHSNRSAAYLQAARQWSSTEEAYARALCDADRAVSLRPSWFKGYTRQGDAYFKLRRYGTACEAYEMALQLDPRNTTVANTLAETRLRAKQASRDDLEMRRTLRTNASSSLASTLRSTTGALSEDDSMNYTREAPAPTSSLFGGHSGSARRSSDGRSSEQLWAELKHEVEDTTHEPTGDAYRLQQLERFRKRGTAEEAAPPRRTFASAAAEGAATADVPRATQPEKAEQQHAARQPEMHSTPLYNRDVSHRTGMTPPPMPPAKPSVVAATAPPPPPPRRSSYAAPTAGGIPAAMASFQGPVHSARDVPYEFSSAAASAYQQKLLDEFRQRKQRQQHTQ